MNKTYLMTVFAVVTLALGGCHDEGKFTGAGHMLASNNIDKATFAFNTQKCDGTVDGNFKFLDKTAGVKLIGTVTEANHCQLDNTTSANTCVATCSVGEFQVKFDYESANPKNPGTGNGFACVTAGGEGNTVADAVYVAALSGPYSGYQNLDTSVSGNIQTQKCEEEKTEQ